MRLELMRSYLLHLHIYKFLKAEVRTVLDKNGLEYENLTIRSFCAMIVWQKF